MTFGFFLFGTVGTLAGASDIRILRSGPLKGASRIARHLWRMTFALFIAALSFFIGQAKVIPKPIRITPLLMTPVLVVLVTMLYWLWRVRIRKGWRVTYSHKLVTELSLIHISEPTRLLSIS